MAKKKEAKAKELKEVSRQEVNGVVFITYEDGSVKIIPAPINLTKEQAEEIFGSEEDEDEEEREGYDSDRRHLYGVVNVSRALGECIAQTVCYQLVSVVIGDEPRPDI